MSQDARQQAFDLLAEIEDVKDADAELLSLRRWGLVPDKADFESDSTEAQTIIGLTDSKLLVEEIEAEAAKLAKSFKDEFLQAQLGELAVSYRGRVKQLADHMENQRASLAALRAQIALQPADKSNAMLAADLNHVRQAMRLEDETQRHHVFSKAIEQGDELVFRSFTQDPLRGAMPMLPPEILEHGEEHWRSLRDPEKARRVKNLRGLVGQFRRAVAEVESTLQAVAGINQDPVADVAAGRSAA